MTSELYLLHSLDGAIIIIFVILKQENFLKMRYYDNWSCDIPLSTHFHIGLDKVKRLDKNEAFLWRIGWKAKRTWFWGGEDDPRLVYLFLVLNFNY